MTNEPNVDLFLRVLRKRLTETSIAVSDEAAMQASVESALAGIGRVDREVRLSARDRVDFFVGDPFGVAIELKLARSGGGVASVLRQLERYAEHVQVRALVLITSSYELTATLPSSVGGKALHIINVGAAF